MASGQTTSSVDAALKLSGGISGTVRGPDGHPVAGICAEAVPVFAGASTIVGVSTAGGYRIVGIQPGSYRVRFTAGCGATGYATQWWQHASARTAKVIVVHASHMVTGIDASLHS